MEGFGDRLCAFLTVKVTLTDGKRAASNIAVNDPRSSQLPSLKASTAKGWVTVMIDGYSKSSSCSRTWRPKPSR